MWTGTPNYWFVVNSQVLIKKIFTWVCCCFRYNLSIPSLNFNNSHNICGGIKNDFQFIQPILNTCQMPIPISSPYGNANLHSSNVQHGRHFLRPVRLGDVGYQRFTSPLYYPNLTWPADLTSKEQFIRDKGSARSKGTPNRRVANFPGDKSNFSAMLYITAVQVVFTFPYSMVHHALTSSLVVRAATALVQQTRRRWFNSRHNWFFLNFMWF